MQKHLQDPPESVYVSEKIVDIYVDIDEYKENSTNPWKENVKILNNYNNDPCGTWTQRPKDKKGSNDFFFKLFLIFVFAQFRLLRT